MQRFHTIGIIGKVNDPGVTDTITHIVRHLQRSGHPVVLDAESAREVPGDDIVRHEWDELVRAADLLIAVGGDGTLLHAARLLTEHEVPILGINRGRMGFLVDVSPGRLDEIDAVLAGEFILDNRMLLAAEIRRGEEVLSQGIALNDVVLHKWNTARMIDFETYIDGELTNRHHSDGLIIATPTGSTAYAMSGGGPILHPSLDAITLVPICPHSLSNRPLVISAESTIEIAVHPGSLKQIRVSCDGQEDLGLVNGGRIILRKHTRKAHLIHPPHYRYFGILRTKLRWGETNFN
ncbi:MAG TPA: NAD(+) kinase [Nitrococcus sp.]|nr:NAD(+) kinase [Nitrococcus sp.]